MLSHVSPRHHAACIDDLPARAKTAHSPAALPIEPNPGPMMTKRTALLLLLLGCVLGASPSHAQSWPSRPVTVFVTAAPGGVTDVVTRAVGQKLSEMWGQPILVENKGGAAHMLGAQAVARAAPDGYTLLAADSGAFVLNPSLYTRDKLGYEVGKDIVPITGLVRINQSIAARNDLPVANIRELIALARQQPGKLTYGTAAVGSALHVNMLKFENMAQVKMQAIHYRGAAPAVADVMAGHIDLICVSTSLVAPPFRDQRLKILGVGSLHRATQLPEVPTVAESLPGFEAVAWFGLAATGGTPQEIITKVNTDVQKVMSDPVFRTKFMEPQMFEWFAVTPEQFADYIRAETENWAKIIREQNLTIQ
jgi:tripartite-type tricarboxylate transporter receptor subunit TctC